MNESLRTLDGRHVLALERRFAHPVEQVWRATGAKPAALLEYRSVADGSEAGRVRWVLAPGYGGTRLGPAQTIPWERADERHTALHAWAEALESLAQRLRQ